MMTWMKPTGEEREGEEREGRGGREGRGRGGREGRGRGRQRGRDGEGEVVEMKTKWGESQRMTSCSLAGFLTMVSVPHDTQQYS